jgi:hypothetical protein
MTDVMLTGGARLVETSVAAAGILALLYTGTPDEPGARAPAGLSLNS